MLLNFVVSKFVILQAFILEDQAKKKKSAEQSMIPDKRSCLQRVPIHPAERLTRRPSCLKNWMQVLLQNITRKSCPVYDDSPRRGTRQAQLVEEVVDTSHSSEEVFYDAVTSVNVCVFSSPCKASLEFTSTNISTSALKCKRVKEMNQSPRETEQASEKYN